MSTDVSPRYSIYLGYASLAEMGNIAVDFKERQACGSDFCDLKLKTSVTTSEKAEKVMFD